jgi:hypothetical protein
MKALICGGTFDQNGGKPSKIMAELGKATGWPVINGGKVSDLEAIEIEKLDVLVWAPNVDNAETKLLPQLKVRNPKLLLVSTKRVVEKSYSDFDVIGRLLKSRSNLGIKFTKAGDRYEFKLLDPLGNCFSATSSIDELGAALKGRVEQIRALTRIGSVSLGAYPGEVQPAVDTEFVDLVRLVGDEFSRYVNAINPERFLGNASARSTDRITRCCHGFPAARSAGETGALYLVSRRNVDKTTMSASDFVLVTGNEDKVEYFGDVKPSVDAPIQVRLFNYYEGVRFMVHGHVYVAGAPTTHSLVPCGHIEEFDEILALYPDRKSVDFCVNLKGHGCLILAKDLDFIRKQIYKARPFPELISD